jgi:hypothetical protein
MSARRHCGGGTRVTKIYANRWRVGCAQTPYPRLIRSLPSLIRPQSRHQFRPVPEPAPAFFGLTSRVPAFRVSGSATDLVKMAAVG